MSRAFLRRSAVPPGSDFWAACYVGHWPDRWGELVGADVDLVAVVVRYILVKIDRLRARRPSGSAPTMAHTADWATVTGVPYILRLSAGQRRPRRPVAGKRRGRRGGGRRPARHRPDTRRRSVRRLTPAEHAPTDIVISGVSAGAERDASRGQSLAGPSNGLTIRRCQERRGRRRVYPAPLRP